MTKAAHYRNQSIEELLAILSDTRKEKFNLVNEYGMTRKASQSHIIRQKKKDIARILTLLSEKEKAEQA